MNHGGGGKRSGCGGDDGLVVAVGAAARGVWVAVAHGEEHGLLLLDRPGRCLERLVLLRGLLVPLCDLL